MMDQKFEVSLHRLAESLERDELYRVAIPTTSATTAIKSDFLTRNRYLSRIGAPVRTIFSDTVPIQLFCFGSYGLCTFPFVVMFLYYILVVFAHFVIKLL